MAVRVTCLVTLCDVAVERTTLFIVELARGPRITLLWLLWPVKVAVEATDC